MRQTFLWEMSVFLSFQLFIYSWVCPKMSASFTFDCTQDGLIRARKPDRKAKKEGEQISDTSNSRNLPSSEYKILNLKRPSRIRSIGMVEERKGIEMILHAEEIILSGKLGQNQTDQILGNFTGMDRTKFNITANGTLEYSRQNSFWMKIEICQFQINKTVSICISWLNFNYSKMIHLFCRLIPVKMSLPFDKLVVGEISHFTEILVHILRDEYSGPVATSYHSWGINSIFSQKGESCRVKRRRNSVSGLRKVD